jgi:ribonuclease BN (tRNA processing enzyme)
MRLQFIGCGDAFGSGGRSNTCMHITGNPTSFLFDCGASAPPAMKQHGVDPNTINLILITHFHGDHFGGIPFFILEAMFVTRRTQPLIIAGPPGLTGWYERVMTATFPGERMLPFPLSLHEVEIGKPQTIAGLTVTPYHVRHDDKAGPCLAYRVEVDGRTISYSGDTEWTDALMDAGHGADLFVCECYTFEKLVPAHLNYRLLREKLPAIAAKRTILTHMSEDMLAHLGEVEYDTAKDGMLVTF